MSSINTTPPSKFSANTKQLKRFHAAQRFRTIIPMGLVVCLAIATFWTYNFYQNSTSIGSGANTSDAAQGIGGTPIDNPADKTAPVEPREVDVATNDNADSPTQNSERIAPRGGSSASNNSQASNGIPADIVTAMNSIESSGVINNPYITASTQDLPADIAVVFNRASWQQDSETKGTVSADILAQGQSRTASITFETVSGTWKVTGYSLVE